MLLLSVIKLSFLTQVLSFLPASMKRWQTNLLGYRKVKNLKPTAILERMDADRATALRKYEGSYGLTYTIRVKSVGTGNKHADQTVQ